MDYTILGAGIVGLSTAIELKLMSPNSKVLILDKKTYPVGASTKNAGFACFGSVSEILDDIELFGEDICQKLIAMRWRGLKLLKARISESNMDYKNLPGIEIFEENKEDYYHSKMPYVNSFVEHILNKKDCFKLRKGKYGSETTNSLEGCLNPQKMMSHLEMEARKLGIIFLQGINVNNISSSTCELVTDLGTILYKKLIVCTNGFSKKLIDSIDLQPARNQVIVTSKMNGFSLDGCYHMNKGYVYFREVNSRLILGGGRHIAIKEETTDLLGNTEQLISYLIGIAKTKILKHDKFEIEKKWSGILGVGSDKMPIVKKIDENILVAVRMGGMGVAIGSFIGRVAASIFLEIDNSDLQLFVRK